MWNTTVHINETASVAQCSAFTVAKLWQNYLFRCGFIGSSSASDSSVVSGAEENIQFADETLT